jgi:hypothetical protein
VCFYGSGALNLKPFGGYLSERKIFEKKKVWHEPNKLLIFFSFLLLLLPFRSMYFCYGIKPPPDFGPEDFSLSFVDVVPIENH